MSFLEELDMVAFADTSMFSHSIQCSIYLTKVFELFHATE